MEPGPPTHGEVAIQAGVGAAAHAHAAMPPLVRTSADAKAKYMLLASHVSQTVKAEPKLKTDRLRKRGLAEPREKTA
eukprot:13923232-Alexandrium_andersonii.AAC.1